VLIVLSPFFSGGDKASGNGKGKNAAKKVFASEAEVKAHQAKADLYFKQVLTNSAALFDHLKRDA